MKKILRVGFIYLPIVITLVVVGIVFLVTENNPAVISVKTGTAADVARSRVVAKRVIKQILTSKTTTIITLNEKDIDGLFTLMNRRVSRLTGDSIVSTHGLEGAITLQLPRNPLGNYVNLRFRLKPSANGLEIGTTSLGRIPLPGVVMTVLIRQSINFVLGDDTGSKLIQSVTATEFEGDVVKLGVKPVPDLRERLQVFSNGRTHVQKAVSLPGHRDVMNSPLKRLNTPCVTSAKATIHASRPFVEVSYREPTTNADGTPLSDLKETRIYYDLGNGRVLHKVIPRSKPQGGGKVPDDIDPKKKVETINFSVSPGTTIQATICITATDESGNESL